jgi:hypothetical protein
MQPKELGKKQREREHTRRSAAASAAAASLYPTGVTPQQEASEEAAARYTREWAAQQGAASGAAAASSGAAAASSGAAASSSGAATGAKRKDAEIQQRLVAKNLGTTVNMMDAQAQALQDAAKIADAQMTQVAVQTPVPKSQPKAKTMGKTHKGPITKLTVNAPELKHASEVKKINAQAAKMSKPVVQADITLIKTGKPLKPAPTTKPVKKVRLKSKPVVKTKETPTDSMREKALQRKVASQRKEKTKSDTEVPTPKLAKAPRKETGSKGSKSGKDSKGKKRTVIVI